MIVRRSPYARVRGWARTVIQGPDELGTVIATEGEVRLPAVTLDCPPPEERGPCRVTVTLKTRNRLPVSPSRKKSVTLGWVTYDLETDDATAELEPVPMGPKGRELLERLGTVSALANVTVLHDQPVVRDFTLMLTSV